MSRPGRHLPAWPTSKGKRVLRNKIHQSKAKGHRDRGSRRAMKRRA